MVKKIVIALILVLLFCSNSFALVKGRAISREKEVGRNGRTRIKVTAEYTFPDNSKKNMVVGRYYADVYSERQVEKDIRSHCRTITKYYIAENQTKIIEEEVKIIDAILAEEMPTIEVEINTIAIPELGITLDTKGAISENYR